jgi:hypothetical protein
MKMIRTYLLVILALLFLSACSGLKTYPDIPGKNVRIQTKLIGSVDADISIHKVNAKCETEYLGTVDLDNAVTEIGITPNQLTYLYASFESSGFLGKSTGTVGYGTLFRPRAGNEYRVELRYKDSIYNVELIELSSGKKSGRELEQHSLDDCKKL